MWARAHVRGMALSALSPQHFTEPNSDEMRPSYGPLKSGIGREPARPRRARRLRHAQVVRQNCCIMRITRITPPSCAGEVMRLVIVGGPPLLALTSVVPAHHRAANDGRR